MSSGLKKLFDRIVASISVAAVVIQPVLAQQTVVTAPGGTDLNTGSGNGVPLVMIEGANPDGVSHNIFDQFDVGSEGLILNNNATPGLVTTDLGGLIVPNGNLNGTAASLILNEVTGANASQLLGTIEIGGSRADMVIANPYGITCDGCGFLNTGNLTLTTGTPTWEGSSFTGLSVDDGKIEIGPKGADGTGALTFGLISRQLVVNGPVTGQSIRVVLGRNDVVYATGEVTEKADDGSVKPALSIDSSLLGGMYANAISITSTEDGVGARAPRNMAASAGEMRITADGRLVIGRASARGPVRVQATGPIEVEERLFSQAFLQLSSLEDFRLHNNAVVRAEEAVTISARNLVAEAASEISSQASVDVTLSGNATLGADAALLSENNVTLVANRLTSDGRIAASGGTLRIDAVAGIENSGVAYGRDGLTLRSDGVIENDGGTLLAGGNLAIGGLTTASAAELRNLDGGVIETTSGDIVIAAARILNARPDPLIDGLVAGTPDATGDTCPTGATIASCDPSGYNPDNALPSEITLQGAAAQIISGGNITLTGTSAENRYSLISAAGNITLNLDTLENIGLGLYEPSADPTILNQVGAVFGTIEAGGVIDANVTGYILNGAVEGNTGVQGGSGSVDPGDLGSDLAGNDLLVPVDDPDAPYLLETRPEFVNPELFISSDYFLTAVGLDPEEAQKRLGDAYAELLYIRKQLLALIGMLRLQPSIDEVAQIKAMYDNAVDAAANLALTPGVALTPDQQAALKSDIIWLEPVTVNGQTVLAPRVYLSDSTRISIAGGAILRGAVINADTGAFGNTGTVFAQGGVRITSNGALTSAGRIEGGTVLLSGTTINIATDSDRRGGEIAFADGAEGQATVLSHGDLVLKAAGDIALRGARIKAGNNLDILAGGGLEVTALMLEARSGSPSGRNHLRKEQISALTSSLRAGGNIALTAEGAAGMVLQATDVAADGTLTIIARRGDLVMEAAEELRFSDYARRSGNFLSRKVIRDQRLDIDNIATNLSASQIAVLSDGDILGRATSFAVPGQADGASGDLVVLSVNQGVAFTHATDLKARHYYKKRSILFGLINNSTDIRSLYTLARGSSGEISGDLLLQSGADLTLTAVDYNIGGEFRTEVAGVTYVLSAVEMAYRAVISHKDNGIIVTDHRSESITETARHNRIKAAGGVFFDQNAPIVLAALRDPRFEATHPGSWLGDNNGRMALAEASFNPATDSESANAADATEGWRDDFTWAEEGNLAISLLELPGAADGAGYGYLPGLLARESTTSIPTELISYNFSETKRSISPAFMALVSIAVGQWVGNLGMIKGIESTFWQAAAKASLSSTITQTAAGVVSGDLDLGRILEGAAFAGLSAGMTAGVNAKQLGIEFGQGAHVSLLGVGDDLTLANLVERGIDSTLSAGLASAVYGTSFGKGFTGSFTNSAVNLAMADFQTLIGDQGLKEGGFGHATLHGLVGCVAAEAQGADCRAGVLAGVAQSVYAGRTDLLERHINREKHLAKVEMVSALAAYLASGGDADNVSIGASVGESGFENNALCGGLCIVAIIAAAGYVLGTGDGDPVEGLRRIGRGDDLLSELADMAGEEALAFASDNFPDETAYVIAKIAAAGEAANVVIQYADAATGEIVSTTWNDIPQSTRDAIVGGTKVVTFIIPAGAAGRITRAVPEGRSGIENQTGNVVEGEVGTYADLAPRSVRDGMTPDHIPSFAAMRENLRRSGVDVDSLSDVDLRALRNNTNCVVVRTCDHQTFLRTYGGRNNRSQVQLDAQDLRRAADADLDTWEPVWRQNGWSEAEIETVRRQVHEYNQRTFEELGVDYGSD